MFGITDNAIKQAGKFYIPNPANPGENFADKWDKNPDLPKAFFEWVNNARSAFGTSLIEKADSMEFGKKLEESLGIKSREIDSGQKYSSAPAYIKVNSASERRPWGSACV